jgi:hypothetical protein
MKASEVFLILIKAFAPLITLLSTYLSLMLTRWLDSKIKDQELKNIVDKLNVVIPDVVKDIEQSFVAKEKAITGVPKLSDEVAVTAKSMAVDKVKEQIGEKGMGEIKKAMSITDSKANSIIASKIEARVFDLRTTLCLILLPLLFIASCHVSPLVITTDVIKTQESVVKAGDEGVATWYMNKHEICLKNGIKIRDDLKRDGSSIEVAKSTGLETYNKCMENTTGAANKIADLIDLIRAKDRVAAGIALAVARKEKPIEALGYVTPEVIKLVEELTRVIREAGVNR